MPTNDDRTADFVSAAYRDENVADFGSPSELADIVARGPRGAVAVAGLAVAALVAIWLAFFLFVFLPRGAVG